MGARVFVDPHRRSRLTPLFHLYWRLTRGMTLGVRGCVIDAQERVFLVRHGYTPGWHFPGGGVEVGQTLPGALAQELQEEGNIALDAEPILFGMYHNARTARRDHVALYVVRHWRQPAPPVPNAEIVQHGFFARDALPEGTTRGTRERLAEIFDGAPRPAVW